MSEQHTPGPWTLSQEKRWPWDYWISGKDGEIVGVFRLPACITDDTQKSANDRQENARLHANVRLMKAAPVLLAELKQAAMQMEMAAEAIEAGRYDEALLHVNSMCRGRKEAIAKATGAES